MQSRRSEHPEDQSIGFLHDYLGRRAGEQRYAKMLGVLFTRAPKIRKLKKKISLKLLPVIIIM